MIYTEDNKILRFHVLRVGIWSDGEGAASCVLRVFVVGAKFTGRLVWAMPVTRENNPADVGKNLQSMPW